MDIKQISQALLAGALLWGGAAQARPGQLRFAVDGKGEPRSEA